MRIAVFIKRTTFHDGFGGMETQNKVLCEGLAEKGYEIVVFSPKRELQQDSLIENRVSYVFVDAVYRTLFSNVNKKNWFLESVRVFDAEHRKNPFNLIISQSSAGVGIIRKKSVFTIPVLSITHGSIMSELRTRYTNLDGLYELIRLLPDTMFSLHVFFGRQREFIHGSDKIVSVSTYVKKALIDETFAAEEKFVVIHNGIDVDRFEQDPNFDTNVNPSVLFVGRLEKEKGTDVLAQMAKDRDFKNVRFDIYGSGSKEESLYDAVQAAYDTNSTIDEVEKSWDQAQKDYMGVRENFVIHGNVPYNEVLKQYKPGRIFIFPTNRLEGFPMVLPEAMCGGCAIVAYDIGGVSDAIIDNESGLLIKSGDISTFKSSVKKLIRDSDLRIKLGKNARIKAVNDFSINSMIKNYETVIKDILK